MAENNQFIQLSVFDRLDNQSDYGVIGGRSSDIHIVRNSVLRDVENLLNTRRIFISPPKSYTHLNKSLFVYGIEDFVNKNPVSSSAAKELKINIKDTLRKFEPRLRNVTVEINEMEGNEHNLCFTVIATLFADPIHEPIFFDTWFYVNRGEYKIQDSR